MIVGVGVRVDVQGLGEAAVALEDETLVVALERSVTGRPRVGARGEALGLLLAPLAGAGDEGLGEAGLVLLAEGWGVALLDADVVAGFPDLAAGLAAVRARDADVLALAGPVAQFFAFVSSAL